MAPNDTVTPVSGFTVAITDGYQKGADVLSIDDAAFIQGMFAKNPMRWNADTGVLMVAVTQGLKITAFDAFTFIKANVKFTTTSNSATRRNVVYTLGYNMIWDTLSQSFLEYKPIKEDTFAQASNLCSSSSFFGLTGRLATIQGETENILFMNLGASEWISAAATSAINQWFWNPTSANPTLFWSGARSLGLPQNGMYAQWDFGQPNPFVSPDNQYAFFTTSGKWISVTDTGLKPAGVLCQYGSATTSASAIVAGLRVLQPAGCFVRPCVTYDKSTCTSNSGCLWKTDSCVPNQQCSLAPDQGLADCEKKQLCFWNYDTGMCMASATDTCTVHSSQTDCLLTPNECQWIAGLTPSGCVKRGCARYSSKYPCGADPTCRWVSSDNNCVARLCGYTSSSQCWSDPLCEWSAGACAASSCAAIATDVLCNAKSMCGWSTISQNCQYKRCYNGSTVTQASCMKDSGCVWYNNACNLPTCSGTQSTCKANNARCYYEVTTQQCVASLHQPHHTGFLHTTRSNHHHLRLGGTSEMVSRGIVS